MTLGANIRTLLSAVCARDLKSEFQHVEERMRLAVEALSYGDRLASSAASAASEPGESGHCSGYQPGSFTARMERRTEAIPSPMSSGSSEASASAASEAPPLARCHTYTQIPVDRGQGAGQGAGRQEVWRVEVARWRLGWARRGGDTQTISYTATLTEYR